LYKFLLKKITIITIKRYIYSVNDESDEERCFDIWLMIHANDFREFPIIPDPDRDAVRKKNIYNWFRYWFRPGVSNTRPARAFCAASDSFWEFSND